MKLLHVTMVIIFAICIKLINVKYVYITKWIIQQSVKVI